jgi:hypothetical protein
MKRFVCTILAFLFFNSAFAQVPDTLTPEKKARWKIRQIPDKAVGGTPHFYFQESLSALADMAVTRVPYLTMRQLRAGAADTASLVHVIEGPRSGIFALDASARPMLDDSAMNVVVGNRRFTRQDMGYVRPEWWGARRDSVTDDYLAFQKMFNWIAKSGKAARVMLSQGTYVVKKSLRPKPLSMKPKYNYDLTIEGQGDWSTVVLCEAESDVSSVIEFTYGEVDFNGRSSGITISGVRFNANGKARHAIHFRYIAGLDMSHCTLNGGIENNLTIDGESDNYGISIRNVYAGGWGKGGHNTHNFYLRRVRYGLFDRITTDGSKYGMRFDLCDKNFIINCHLEGSKTACLWLNGGENKVTTNFFLPYAGYEPNAVFRGDQYAVRVDAPGGSANNIISNNVFATYNNTNLIVTTIFGFDSKLTASPGDSYTITGATSGATGLLIGFNRSNGDAVIQKVKGTFVRGEKITQPNPHKGGKGSGVLGAFIPTKSVGLGLYGSAGYNTVTGNQIRGTQDVAIWNASDLNVITSNTVEAHGTTFYNASSRVLLTANMFYAPDIGKIKGKAIESVSGIVYARNNYNTAGSETGTISREFTSAGTVGYIPQTTADGSIANSVIQQNAGGEVGLGVSPSGNKLHISGGQFPLKLESQGAGVLMTYASPGKAYHVGIDPRNAHSKEWAVFDATANTTRFMIHDDGNVKVGSDPTNNGYKLEVQGGARATQFYLSSINTAPPSATSKGTAGELRFTDTGIYICVATNKWIKCVGSAF